MYNNNRLIKTALIPLCTLMLTGIAFAEEKPEGLTANLSGMFVAPTLSLSSGSAKNINGSSSSQTVLLGAKAGIQRDSYRYYANYDYIGFKNGKASLVSACVDYLVPLGELAGAKAYIGASAGLANIDGDYSGSKTKANFGFQAGVIQNITSKAFLELGYRYVNTGNIKAERAASSTREYSFMKLDNISAITLAIGWRW